MVDNSYVVIWEPITFYWWDLFYQGKKVAGVEKRRDPKEYLLYMKIPLVDGPIKCLSSDDVNNQVREIYSHYTPDVTDEEIMTETEEWDNLNTLKSSNSKCWQCNRNDGFHWFWCVKICRKCTHLDKDKHWHWCEEFTTDEDECDDSCESGCVKCQAPRETELHKDWVLSHGMPRWQVDSRYRECEWACSMNPGVGCNFPDCLPVPKPKIRDLQKGKNIIWCTVCKKWEHVYSGPFWPRSCGTCKTFLNKMELYYES